MRTYLIIIPAVLSIAASAIAIADITSSTPGEPITEYRHHHHHGHGFMMHALKKLDLSDAQKTSIRQLVHTSYSQAQPQYAALRQQRQALEATTPGTSAYQAAAASLAQSEAIAASARVEQKAALGAQVYALLTDSQRSQFATLQAQHQAKLAQWQAEHPAAATPN